jgi:hypothetical protein
MNMDQRGGMIVDESENHCQFSGFVVFNRRVFYEKW